MLSEHLAGRFSVPQLGHNKSKHSSDATPEYVYVCLHDNTPSLLTLLLPPPPVPNLLSRPYAHTCRRAKLLPLPHSPLLSASHSAIPHCQPGCGASRSLQAYSQTSTASYSSWRRQVGVVKANSTTCNRMGGGWAGSSVCQSKLLMPNGWHSRQGAALHVPSRSPSPFLI